MVAVQGNVEYEEVVGRLPIKREIPRILLDVLPRRLQTTFHTASNAPFLKGGEKTGEPVEPIHAVFTLLLACFYHHCL